MNEMEKNRNEYKNLHMNEQQLEEMKARMEQAKEDRKNAKRFGKTPAWAKVAASAAVVALVLVALPNTSPTISYAMEQIPVIGSVVKLVSRYHYTYESQRHSADVDVPKLESEDKTLEKTTQEINEEIDRISKDIISEFEAGMKDEEGYQDVMVKSELLTTTPDYFVLKLICYQGSGSGAEWDYYYTVDLKTGERLQLSDLFEEGADYVTPISESIKEQMRTRMKEDDNVCYWIDDEEFPDMNFMAIKAEEDFYINDKGNLVICFDEGDVAPMYMGCVSFEIPKEVVKDIWKLQ
ncbi:MAG: RsiV family protein [Lachnospiraceae bacterium]|nr:RsiV family protein [Lachnospiraceae bacterium]